jgi:outer membrane protein assembly factor BamB
VFWRVDDEVRRVAHAGGAVDVLGTTIAGGGFDLAVDDDFVYFARGETVVRHALADGAVSDLFQNRRSTALALAGDTLFGTTCAGDDTADAVWSMPADGSAPPHRLLATGCPEGLTVDDSFVYMFDLVEGRPGIQRLSQSGGDALRLVESPSSVFAVRDGFVYAIDVDDRVVRVHATGGEPEILLDMPVAGLAVDDTHLYYTQRNDLSELVLFRTPLR